jgi:hypothetical protein
MSTPSTALTILPPAAAPDTELAMRDLPSLLKQWMTLETDISKMNAELRERRTHSRSLRAAILKIMDKHNVVQLNVNKGSVLHKTREKKDSLSTTYLAKTAEAFFEGDKEKAAQLVKYLEEHRGTSVVHDLRFAAVKSDAL